MTAEGTGSADRGAKVFRKNPDVVTRKIAGELFLVPIRGKVADMQRIFSLNPVGELIWESMDAQENLDDIRDKVVSHFDVSRETAMTDIEEFMAELLQAKLIVE